MRIGRRSIKINIPAYSGNLYVEEFWLFTKIETYESSSVFAIARFPPVEIFAVTSAPTASVSFPAPTRKFEHAGSISPSWTWMSF